ncbi:MAG: thiol-disulfide isomerase and thioredoxin [Microbacterium sp.]|nr:thiol-disulfide isomerase and thioredoxin [Microbacterium sp.]
MTTLTLIGKPDCHLCEVAEQIVETVVAELPSDVADRVTISHASIADDAALYEKWWEKIPVVLVDGQLHAHWRVSADRLRATLLAANPEGASA